jgi:two-component system NtrC family response regulator
MARILIVDDDAALRADICDTLADLGHTPVAASDGGAALTLLDRQSVDAVILDLRMPGLSGLEVLQRIRARPSPPPVAILTAVPTAENTIEAMRLGAIDHLAKPVKRAELAELLTRMLAPAEMSAAEPVASVQDGELVGASAAMREVQKAIGRLADSDATVLITGETGTGKEVVSRALHRHGKRAPRPFVPINCAAIPKELLESELFGHIRGAFTGATSDRLGSLREANGGTVLLDEIGDMDLAMQAKLLRVIQERVVVPVGGKPVSIDVRIIAATHRDLAVAVREGRFREDLFYRLGVVPLRLPSLRERLADIVPLAEYFLALSAQPKRLSAAAAARLLAHNWPGNVRELRNAIQRATAMTGQSVLQATDFDFLEAASPEPAIERQNTSLPDAVRRLEETMIRQALAASGGNRAEAARSLGIHRQLLHTKMRLYGMTEPD